jgi:transcriptional regulator with XRE-family HTH domain
MEIKEFPNKLKSFRRQRGYSRKKVARVLGHADTSTLSRWERGLVLPGLLQTFHLARIYNVLPHELFITLWNELAKDQSLSALEEELFTSNQIQLS